MPIYGLKKEKCVLIILPEQDAQLLQKVEKDLGQSVKQENEAVEDSTSIEEASDDDDSDSENLDDLEYLPQSQMF